MGMELLAQAAEAAGGGLGLLLASCIGLLFYFLPAFVAFMRGHQNTVAIFLVNLLLGWTFIGWVVALVWAFTAVQPPGGSA